MSSRRWFEIDKPCDHFGPAVYRIRLLGKNGKAFPMRRLTGTDAKGLLSIGKTSNMKRRRRQFYCGYTQCYLHSEGNLLNLLLEFSKLKKAVGTPRVQYQFEILATDVEAKELEGKLLKDYLVRFAEVPPLNSAIPSRYDRESWCTIKS